MNRKVEFDNVRVFAAISVLGIHVLGQLVLDGKKTNLLSDDLSLRWVSNIYNSFFRSGIPLFLILTGALNLPKADGGFSFVKKRFIRILIPYIIWSSVYLIAKYNSSGITLFEATTSVIFGAHYHLWFVNVVLILYLIMPFLKPLLDRIEKFGLASVLIIMFCLFIINSQFTGLPWLETFTEYICSLCYISIGYYLVKHNSAAIKDISLGVFLFLAGFSITLLAGMGFVKTAFFNYESYSSFHILLKSVGGFILINVFSEHIPYKFQLRVSTIGKYSFGIYLIHPLVLHVLNKGFGISYKFISPFIGIPFTTIACLLISFFLLYFLDKLSFGRYLY